MSQDLLGTADLNRATWATFAHLPAAEVGRHLLAHKKATGCQVPDCPLSAAIEACPSEDLKQQAWAHVRLEGAHLYPEEKEALGGLSFGHYSNGKADGSMRATRNGVPLVALLDAASMVWACRGCHDRIDGRHG